MQLLSLLSHKEASQNGALACMRQSVPVYWGAPDVLELLPHPTAIVDARAFASVAALAAYLDAALTDASVYAHHSA